MSAIKSGGGRCLPRPCLAILGFLVMVSGFGTIAAADSMPNACPVDGCEVKIIDVQPSGKELELTFEANFSPDVSKNHIHVWWGEKFTIEQVGRGAKPIYGVEKGSWHRHDDYPKYVTQGAASTGERDGAVSICVSAADRDHNILDIKAYHCVDVAKQL